MCSHEEMKCVTPTMLWASLAQQEEKSWKFVGFFAAKHTLFTPNTPQRRHKSRADDKFRRKCAHFYSSAAEARPSLGSPQKQAAHCFFVCVNFFSVNLFQRRRENLGWGGVGGGVGAGASHPAVA